MKKIIIIIGLMIILSGCDVLESEPSNNSQLLEQNNTGMQHMENGDFDKALEAFQRALAFDEDDDSILNNLSWAYYSLGEYDKSYDFIQKALAIKPNSEQEYINAGNVIVEVGTLEDAVEHFNKALDLNPESDIALYGLGVAYYHMGLYVESVEAFDQSLIYDPSDIDAMTYKIGAMIELEDYLSANSYLDQMINVYPDSYELKVAKAEVLSFIDKKDNVVKYYKELINDYPDDTTLYYDLGMYYYEIGDYQSAIDTYDSLLEIDVEYRAYLMLSYTHSMMADQDKAREYANLMVSTDPENYEGYNAIANAYLEEGYHLKALAYYDQAIEFTEDETPVVNIMYTLLEADRFSRAIEYGEAYFNDGYEDADVSWYVAESYYHKNEFTQAVNRFKNHLKLYPDAKAAHYYLSIAYGELNMKEESIKHAKLLLEAFPDDISAGELLQEMMGENEDIDVLLEQLLSEYYLYPYKTIDVDVNGSDEQISDAFDQMIDINDPYSFAIYGEDYHESIKLMESLDLVELTDETLYIHIPYFDANTDHLFIELLDSIETPKDKTIIIDLTNNGGGLTDSANTMLDAMLPTCLMSQIIFKDGYTYSYYSEASMIEFRNVVVLVNEYTASAAELFTLGLRTYLDNVEVIGETTHGKGVGQYVYDDKVNERLYFIVNHYWNVREYNVNDNKIKPDTHVIYEDLYTYLSERYNVE